MTNKERQKSLDEKKWLESEKQCEDMSGKMEYCECCSFADWWFNICDATQEERENKCLCATAYNRMKRAQR